MIFIFDIECLDRHVGFENYFVDFHVNDGVFHDDEILLATATARK